MVLSPQFTKQFRKDYKRMVKQGKKIELLDHVMETLMNQITLPRHNKDHELKGKLMGCRECHIKPDWLLIYRLGTDYISFERTGSHAELFRI